MTEHIFIKVTWHGGESVDEAKEALAAGQPVELDLPPETSHALFSHLFPDAPPGEPEIVNERGGAELIERVSGISMMGRLKELMPLVQQAGLYVAAVSPPPTLLLTPHEEDLTQTGAGTGLPGTVL